MTGQLTLHTDGRWGATPILALGILLLSGCGDNSLRRQAVQGEVWLDGKPLDRAIIVFTPIGSGLAAAAEIQAGRFSLTRDDGPTCGEFHVRINPQEVEIENVEHEPVQSRTRHRPPRVPLRYQSEGALRATITTAPGQALKFELTSG